MSLDKIAWEVYGEDAPHIVKSYDLIGDIAVIKLPDHLLDERRFLFAERILREYPYIKVVLRQRTPVKGVYRVRRMEHLAGERRTTTIYKEHGLRFKVDLDRVYFSPRLSYERRRIASLAGEDETVVNMFAGVGTFSIHLARKGCIVHSIDINPVAIDLHLLNNLLNKVSRNVITYLGDAGETIGKYSILDVDRVLMPLPEKALEYVGYALKSIGREGWIHIYLHVEGESEDDALDKGEEEAVKSIESYGYNVADVHSRVVREVAPHIYQVCVDTHCLKP